MPLPPPPLNGAADSVSSAASLYQAYYSQGPGMGPAATQPAAAGGSYSSVVPGGGASAPPNAYPAANPQQSYNPQTTFDSGYAVEMGADGEVHVSGSIPAGVPVSAQPAALSDSDLLAVAAPTTPTMSRSVGFAAPATEPETNSMARTNSASRPPRIKKRATYIRAMVSVLGTFMLPIIFTMCWMRTQPLPIDGSTQLTSFLYHALGVGAPLAFTIYGDLGGGDVDVVIYSSAAYMFAFAGIWYAFGTLSAPPTDFMMYSDFIAIACALIGFFIVGGLFQLLITGKWRWIVPARLGGIDEEYVWWKTSRRPVRGSVAKTDLYYGDGLDHSKDTVSKLAASSFMPTIPDPETIPLKKSGVPIAVSGSPAMGYPDDKSSIYTHMNTLSAMPVEQPDDDDHEEEGFLWGSNDFGTLANDDDEDDYHVQNDLESPALKSGSLARPAAYNSLSQRSVANSELSAGYPTQVASMSRPAVPADVPWYSKESKTWTDMGWTSRYMIAKLFIWGHIAVGSFVMGIHMKSPESWRCGYQEMLVFMFSWKKFEADFVFSWLEFQGSHASCSPSWSASKNPSQPSSSVECPRICTTLFASSRISWRRFCIGCCSLL